MNELEKKIDVAWIAGFLEGEGCFGWRNENRGRLPKTAVRKGGPKSSRRKWIGVPCVNAVQVDKEPLERIANVYPGPIRCNKRNSPCSDIYEYTLYNKPAIDLMVEVYPLMSNRRKRVIEIAIANFTSREAERLNDGLRCPKGHLREVYGFIVKNGSNKGQRACRKCNSEWAQISKERRQNKTISKVIKKWN